MTDTLTTRPALPSGADVQVGARFGQLVVIGATERSNRVHGDLYALRCDCGIVALSYAGPLLRGATRACKGCERKASREHAEALIDHPYWRNIHLRHDARVVYLRALKHGDIQRGEKCERCGTTEGQLGGHHEDYAKPLDVVWLCKSCHGIRHGELGTHQQRGPLFARRYAKRRRAA